MTILNLLETLNQSPINNERKIKEIKNAIKIMKIIVSKGYECYIVGGYTRDRLLGITSTDIDLTTNMPVDEMIPLFNGIGMNSVMASGDKETKVVIIAGVEVAQYRKDIHDENGAFIEAVTGTLEEDAQRRDATINALYEDLQGNVIDKVNGLEDLENRVVRACGDPYQRIKEDSSRILRYAYLSAKLNFKLDDNIVDTVRVNRHMVKDIHPNLKGKIILKAIKSNSFYRFIENLELMGIVFDLFPEFKNMKGLKQDSTFHPEGVDAWTHTKKVLFKAESMRPKEAAFILAALYHDVGKGVEEYIGSDIQPNYREYGKKIAKKSIIDFGFGKDLAKKIAFFIEMNSSLPMLDELEIKNWLKQISKYTDSKQSMFFYANDLLDFDICESYTYNVLIGQQNLDRIERLRTQIQYIISKYPYYLKDLPIDGKFVMEHSKLKGKEIGEFLSKILSLDIVDKELAISMLNKE